ncbi:bucky ball [Polymixia lowei]
MDDGGNPPHSFGSGQQRNHHPRPFFYVQPPSQPYYLYQHWQLNNPYNHYGLPGGYNYGRPCMQPYPYMQYPGFVVPHGQMHPVDYRRMFEPRFHSTPWNDMVRPQHHPQAHVRREVACSEAQTDPSDAITKLIECLGKMRANELSAERELDSGVASQASGIFLPGDEKKNGEPGAAHSSSCATPQSSHLQSPAVIFSDSTAAVYDGESSQRSLEDLSPQGCWSVGFDEELPLDSSSVHEECLDAQHPAVDDDQFLLCRPAEKSEDPTPEATQPEENVSSVSNVILKCNAKDVPKQSVDANMPLTQSLAPRPSSKHQALDDAQRGDKTPQEECQAESPDEVKVDLSYQILKLPFDGALTAGGLAKDVLCGDPPADLASSRLSSPVSPYYYGYLTTQTTRERMSVLSPSLDELSSRDEMFSTDLEEMDLFPQRVYTSRRLAEVGGGVEEVRLPGSKRYACACCGTSLAKGASRSKVHSLKLYGAEAGDSEEECRYGRSGEQPARVVVRKHSVPRGPHSLSLRHAAKHSHKRSQYKDPSSTADQEEERRLGVEHAADGGTGELASEDVQCRTCQDRLCREDVTASDRARWGDGDVKPRRRPQNPPLRQGSIRGEPRC